MRHGKESSLITLAIMMQLRATTNKRLRPQNFHDPLQQIITLTSWGASQGVL
jgi:hypothetical protein